MPRRRSQAHPASRTMGRAPTVATAVAGVAGVLAVAGLLLLGTARANPPDVRSTGGGTTAAVASALPSSGLTGGPLPLPRSTASPEPIPSATSPALASDGRFPGGLLIADRGNGRLLVVNEAGQVTWSFPVRGSLPRGQQFSADDAFVAPDGRTIVANDENHQVIDRIDIRTRRVMWQYGRYDHPGGSRGLLHTPDDAYPLANGDIVVADIRNCRIFEISPAKRVVRHWGRTGVCVHRPPFTFALPNGDTPLPDGGLLITEIQGSRVVRLGPDGRVVFDVHVPVRYPSDAQLAPDGSIVVVDYSKPGAVLRLSPRGRLLWRYGPRAGKSALDHPSLAVPLPDGTIVLNDDGRDRVVIIDPRTNRIVWQYGHTGRAGRAAGFLWIPDGVDVVPPGVIPDPSAGGQ